MKQKILFLCTGNSCRSQMAEGVLRHLGRERVESYSAGTHPSIVNPKAVEVMQEIDIDISSHSSKSVDQFIGRELDWVITVCDRAKESCPVFPGNVQQLHWSFIDPAEAEGDEKAIMKVFREVRNQIHTHIQEFVEHNLS